jgi:Icc-related predicted phosphoesterase
MKRVAWLTDIHLNFVKPLQVQDLLAEVNDRRPDAVLVGGDIAEAPTVIGYLRQMAEAISVPIYFVLGNHDYYFGSIAGVRAAIEQLTAEVPNLVFLTTDGIVELTPAVGLLGHDGWADARLGDYEKSVVMMNDYRLIEELAHWSKLERWNVLKTMGDEAADYLRQHLPTALDRYSHVMFLTHVPPYRDACRYAGRVSDDHWLPHFSCRAMGEAIDAIMRDRPDRRLTVLCGHTHGHADIRPLANVQVLVAPAEYGFPQIERVFEFE